MQCVKDGVAIRELVSAKVKMSEAGVYTQCRGDRIASSDPHPTEVELPQAGIYAKGRGNGVAIRELVPTEVTIRLLGSPSWVLSAQPGRAKPDSESVPDGFPVRTHMRRMYTPCFRWKSVVMPLFGSRIVPLFFRKIT